MIYPCVVLVYIAFESFYFRMCIYRVNGVLAVARSFGDIMYKNYSPLPEELSLLNPWVKEQMAGGLWNSISQPVIAKPEVNPLFDLVLIIIMINKFVCNILLFETFNKLN